METILVVGAGVRGSYTKKLTPTNMLNSFWSAALSFAFLAFIILASGPVALAIRAGLKTSNILKVSLRSAILPIHANAYHYVFSSLAEKHGPMLDDATIEELELQALRVDELTVVERSALGTWTSPSMTWMAISCLALLSINQHYLPKFFTHPVQAIIFLLFSGYVVMSARAGFHALGRLRLAAASVVVVANPLLFLLLKLVAELVLWWIECIVGFVLLPIFMASLAMKHWKLLKSWQGVITQKTQA